MNKLSSQRVAILVDSQNIYLSAKSRGAKPDYSKIMNVINGREIVRAIVYNILPDGVDQSNYQIRTPLNKYHSIIGLDYCA